MIRLSEILARQGPALLCNTPPGLEALLLAQAASELKGRTVLFVARDDTRLTRTAELAGFFAPDVPLLTFPAWDCQPYDRVSPRADIASRRLETLAALARGRAGGAAASAPLVLTTVNALLQRVPPAERLRQAVLRVTVKDVLAPASLLAYLADNGYSRTGTVVEPGEYAVRGGLIDLFPPGAANPVRIDFFGAVVDEIKCFDPASQRSTLSVRDVVLAPVSEVFLDAAAIERFERGYREHFGAVLDDDPLFEAVRGGRKYPGIEHWLPLFHERLETLFDYLPGAAVMFDHLATEAREARLQAIADHYEARRTNLEAPVSDRGVPYKPLPPHALYPDAAEWDERLADRAVLTLVPFGAPESGDVPVFDAGARAARDFTPERTGASGGLYDAVAKHAAERRAQGKRVAISAYSAGTADRLLKLLGDHGLDPLLRLSGWAAVQALPSQTVALVVLGLEHGFEADGFVFLSEQDILGDRFTRPAAKRRRAENFLADVGALGEGDLVVHLDHGVGRFTGLKTLQIAGAPHDCVRLVYEGDDKLFVPVENIDVLSRYGPDQAGAVLDRLGGVAWQSRTARLKGRILEMADELVRIAAERKLKPAPKLTLPAGAYEEFCARFPYAETEDQARAIEETLEDLVRGEPMDRLICGDVGFGKTEVALRAAFVAAMSGKQVAVVVPTTLLCRQHLHSFTERFAGYPIRIGALSRLISARESQAVKEALGRGETHIVIGTHALLNKGIAFHDLGLLIVDEEQHFGVAHKERLKQLKSNVHVLSMTATPIPRTLQLALAGVRAMSVIATPPLDRLAIRTYILPYDAVMVREAILREHYRGGQTFYVCPRIADIDGVVARLQRLVPEVKVGYAHGRVASRALDEVMGRFYDGVYDVLVVTSIIESGLDIPRTNTMIIHRADMFGLAQLYQLRGRIGRSKVRAYAYLTLEQGRSLTAQAEKRLEVLHKLDSLGAGFSLASHDLDIRGAGNLLGREQSGHIREVGVELYQHMIEQAVIEARARRAGEAAPVAATWSPQINIGTAVLIPEGYVADLSVRLSLYRRIATLESREEIDAFGAELADRFGPVPPEVEHLLEIIAIKQLCRRANVARLDGGPKGVAIAFRNDEFANPEALIVLIADPRSGLSLRPDRTILLERPWASEAERYRGVSEFVTRLAQLNEDARRKGPEEDARQTPKAATPHPA